MAEKNKQISKKEALSLITRYCSSEERCVYDVQGRLEEFQLSEIDIDEIIDFLKSEKYIDELRYAFAFVNDKFRFNKWGRLKIEYALKQKKIPVNILSKALTNIAESDYLALLREELSKKLRSLPIASNYELKGKLYRFAASRGFENDFILEVLRELLEE